MELKHCRVCHALRRSDCHCGSCGAYSLKSRSVVIHNDIEVRTISRARGAVSQAIRVTPTHVVEHFRQMAHRMHS